MSTMQKTTSLQITLDQDEKNEVEKITNEKLGLTLSATVKLIIKSIKQTKEIPFQLSFKAPEIPSKTDETDWLLNNPGYGKRLLESVEKVNNKTAKLIKFESMQELENHFDQQK
jgi:antitoxin component of RelBE/YafQ-DinJ toxin-antitoxin module